MVTEAVMTEVIATERIGITATVFTNHERTMMGSGRGRRIGQGVLAGNRGRTLAFTDFR